jgi:hypothetical protein
MRAGKFLAMLSLTLVATSCGFGAYGPWELDPDAANIVPITGPDAASVVTAAPPDSMTPGVEGSVLFIRLIDPAGTTVLDRPFEWPSDEQSVPPGDYTLTAYWRGCNGNCGNLSSESPICQGEVSLTANDRVVGHVIARDLMPGSECTIDEASLLRLVDPRPLS